MRTISRLCKGWRLSGLNTANYYFHIICAQMSFLCHHEDGYSIMMILLYAKWATSKWYRQWAAEERNFCCVPFTDYLSFVSLYWAHDDHFMNKSHRHNMCTIWMQADSALHLFATKLCNIDSEIIQALDDLWYYLQQNFDNFESRVDCKTDMPFKIHDQHFQISNEISDTNWRVGKETVIVPMNK